MTSTEIRQAFKDRAAATRTINSIPASIVCAVIRGRGWNTSQASAFEYSYDSDTDRVTAEWDEYHSGDTDRYDVSFPVTILDMVDEDLNAALQLLKDEYAAEVRAREEAATATCQAETEAKERRELARLQAKYA